MLFYFSLSEFFPQTIFFNSSLVLRFLTAEISSVLFISNRTKLFNPINIHKVSATLDVFILWLRSHQSLIWEEDLVRTYCFLGEFYSQKTAWRSAWASGGGMRASMRKTHVQKSKCTLICLKCPFLWLSTAPPPPLSLWMVFFVFCSKTQSPDRLNVGN